ncbi:HPF/RaiA family ribosome-associated protein [Georgenia yuyongxinii]
MEIIVKGRNTEIADRFRTHVQEKLAKIEQLAPRAQRVEVELRTRRTRDRPTRRSGSRSPCATRAR